MFILRSLTILLLCSPLFFPHAIAGAPPARAMFHAGGTADAGSGRLEPVPAMLGRLPFLANVGQYDARVAYAASLPTGTLFLTRDGGLVYSLDLPAATDGDGSGGRLVLRERLLDAATLAPRGIEPAALKVSRFVAGSDPRDAQVDAQLRVDLGEAWPGIRVEVAARNGNVEKLFHLAARADPSRIVLGLDGAASLALGEDGQLRVATSSTDAAFSTPVAWQMIDGRRRDVAVHYRLLPDTDGTPRYGFALGDYDHRHAVTIDPVLEATTLGGSAGGDLVTGVVRRSSDGAVYVTGTTRSADFPIVSPAFDEVLNTPVSGIAAAAFIARLSADLSTLEAATFLGTQVEHPRITLSGSTVNFTAVTRTDFPVTPGAHAETSNGGGREFVLARLSANLDTLQASTYLGGSGAEQRPTPPQVHSSLITGTTTVCIAGSTSSADYPTTAGAFDTSFNGGLDGVMSCLDGDLATLVASTYFGATNVTTGVRDMVKISSGIALGGYAVVGYTSAAINGLAGGYDTSHNGSDDGFVMRFNGSLGSATGTYLGSPTLDRSTRVYYDSGLDSVFVASETNNSSFAFPITAGAYDTSPNGGQDVVISRLSADLTTLEASTYLGGSNTEYPSGLARDANGKVVLLGYGYSDDLPVTFGAFATEKMDTGSMPNSALDAYIARLDPDLTTLEYGSYFGVVGEHVDEIAVNNHLDIATDAASGIYFPQRIGLATAGTFQQTPDETTLVHMDLGATLPGVAFSPSPPLVVGEDAGPAELAVSRTGDLSTYSYVHWAVEFPFGASAQDVGNSTEGTLYWGAGDATPKSIFIDIVNDDIVENNETFRVKLTGAVGATLPLISGGSRDVHILNDDTAGFELTPPMLTLSEESPGNEGSFGIRLTSQPTDPVAVMLTSNDPNLVFLPAETPQLQIGFSDTNWNQTQSIGIRVLNDDFDNDRVAGIGSQPASSADGNYSGLTIPPVDVTINDAEVAGLAFAESSVVTNESDNATAFTGIHFALGSEPGASVTVQFAIPAAAVDEGVLQAGSDMVMIAPADWNLTQEILVAGVDDAIADGNQLYGLEWSLSSADPDYDGLSGSQPDITNVDNDLTQVDLAISLTPDDPSAPKVGEARGFTAVVANVGAVAASPASVASSYSAAIPMQSWSCVPAGACSPASGNGNIATEVTLGTGESVSIDMQADINGPPGGSAMLDVWVTPGASEVDSNPTDNADHYAATVVSANPDIFADGFE
ncbi:MAG: hypothetical protein KDI75_03780 [Xanthomonadales bacterium]|nr:hypothetical protein [Xanthomonadales bacterium]